MAKELFNRYIWLVDTIKRYGRITRNELDHCWLRSQYSDGQKIPRRTFYNYRQAIMELFNLEIKCDPATYEYYIPEFEDRHSESVTNWLLNSAVVNDLVANSKEVADKIFIEDVPSAREFLAPVIDALRENNLVKFDYLPYYRTIRTSGVVLEPYFVKIFKQRWYVIGRVVAENKVKTYALDRMTDLHVLPEKFKTDPSFDPEDFFRHSFGIITGKGNPKRIALRTDPRQAKYFRALPLHASQEEIVHDNYSIFYYYMRLSADLVEEILSHGPRVTVLEPPELRAAIQTELSEALQNYDQHNK